MPLKEEDWKYMTRDQIDSQQFLSNLTRQEVWAALRGNDPEVSVVIAVEKYVEELVKKLDSQARRLKVMPATFYIDAPRNEVERAGVTIFSQTLAKLPGSPRVAVLNYGE